MDSTPAGFYRPKLETCQPRLKAVALIATHDLKISEMENEYPQMVFNKCFEIKLEKDEMVFDYLLSNGVTKTMNATFLMKKMGII